MHFISLIITMVIHPLWKKDVYFEPLSAIFRPLVKIVSMWPFKVTLISLFNICIGAFSREHTCQSYLIGMDYDKHLNVQLISKYDNYHETKKNNYLLSLIRRHLFWIKWEIQRLNIIAIYCYIIKISDQQSSFVQVINKIKMMENLIFHWMLYMHTIIYKICIYLYISIYVWYVLRSSVFCSLSKNTMVKIIYKYSYKLVEI